MRTQITERLGIAMPLLAFSHSADVVVAVSRAGGMGVLGAAQLSVEELEEKLGWLDEVLGETPYGVDLLLPSTEDLLDRATVYREGMEREALEIIERLKPEKAYLTHLSHQMGKHLDVEKTLPHNVHIAYDGLKISI